MIILSYNGPDDVFTVTFVIVGEGTAHSDRQRGSWGGTLFSLF